MITLEGKHPIWNCLQLITIQDSWDFVGLAPNLVAGLSKHPPPLTGLLKGIRKSQTAAKAIS